ncbi:hypothetical protein LTR85_001167 [Meristemomyces frigidus]|nr:hypothetical protein LTR85_001167 [Meristemomyces frigidus]
MTSEKPKILLTGATGYIGGSILSHLLKSESPALQDTTIKCLVRGTDRVAELNTAYGRRVDPVLFKDLDETDRMIEIASQHDIIINATLGYHPASAAALVEGLAKRQQATGKDVFMIHTSGTSNLADQPITKAYTESDPERVFDDSKDDIYGYEKMRNEQQPYGQRTSELGVIDAGLEKGVKTLVIMSPTIYGVGTGEFNKSSIQVPAYVKATIANGQAVVVGEGKGVWDNVDVEDLAELYTLCLLNILEKHGEDLPFGKKGIIFSENGRHTWKELAQGVADAAYAASKIKSKDVKSVSLEEGAKVLTGGDQLLVELGFSSNSRTKGVVGRKLGWKPKKGPEAWEASFSDEVKAAIEKETK